MKYTFITITLVAFFLSAEAQVNPYSISRNDAGTNYSYKMYVVTVPRLGVRPQPSGDSEPIVVLPGGARVKLLEHHDGDWCTVLYSYDNVNFNMSGYVRTAGIRPIETESRRY